MYILKSLKDGNLYIDSTNDLKRRFEEHNSGLVKSTKPRTPFKLVYYEACASEDDARHREHNLKLRAKALRQLRNRIAKSLASS
jgi:putative endonuclease